jgi:hypothetical protein
MGEVEGSRTISKDVDGIDNAGEWDVGWINGGVLVGGEGVRAVCL